MPIYDLSYRHWDGPRHAPSHGWLPIATTGLIHFLRKRLFLLWLVAAWLPAVVLGVLIYLRVSIDVSNLPDADGAFFHRYFSLVQYTLYLLTAVFVGAGLIANDRRTNALQIYLSKPIRAVDYLLGKGATVAAAVGMVTLAPALALFLFRWGLDRNGGYLTGHLLLPLSIIAGAALIMVTMSILSLTVSSMSRSGRTAGLTLVMMFVFFEATRTMLSLLFSRSISSLLSPVSNLQQGLDWIFGRPPAYGIHPLWSMLALSLMLGICLRILIRRVRPVEVVS